MTTTYAGRGIINHEMEDEGRRFRSGHGSIVIKETGAGAKWAIDCPKCKYGTLEPLGVLAMVCIDCGKIVTRAELVELGIIKKKQILK